MVENDGLIDEDEFLIINKNGIQVSLKHLSIDNALKFELIISNGTNKTIFFDPTKVIVLDEDNIQHKPLTFDQVCERGGLNPKPQNNLLPVDPRKYEEIKNDPTIITEKERNEIVLNTAISSLYEELNKDEKEKLRKERKTELEKLENEVIKNGDISPYTRKSGIIYFHAIAAKQLIILIEIEKQLYRFKFLFKY